MNGLNRCAAGQSEQELLRNASVIVVKAIIVVVRERIMFLSVRTSHDDFISGLASWDPTNQQLGFFEVYEPV